jgi:hypothetical protein
MCVGIPTEDLPHDGNNTWRTKNHVLWLQARLEKELRQLEKPQDYQVEEHEA